ncbi:MAG: PA0069 family radical SAM protein [Thermoanaerobaculia bacterium]
MSQAYVGQPPRGRGSSGNPPNRFEKLHYEVIPAELSEDPEPDERAVATQVLRDVSRSIITYNDSPDVGFRASVNPYRGCEHGCSYCYARPTHEYLGFSAGLDFETRLLVKEDAPELLRRELSSPRWTPQTVVMSGVTDCYQPIERRFQLTRRCLEVFVELRNPVATITKNELVTRDLDLLADLASDHAAASFLSITTLDPELSRRMEPRASIPERRLAALQALAEAGVPCGVMIAPVIPGLNDHEIPAILAAAYSMGARIAGYVPLRLPFAVAPLFETWLEQHLPLRKEKVLNRIRSMRGGKLNDPSFGSRMKGEGAYAEQIAALFAVSSRKVGFTARFPALSAAAFRKPKGPQLSLF